MSVHSIGVLVRAQWQTELSYRLHVVLSTVSLLVGLIPLYFIARALHPLLEPSIATEGGEYFAFLLVGLIVFSFLAAAVNTLPGAVRSGISTGTLEAMLSTPTSVPALLSGMLGYGFAWTGVRSLLALAVGIALGMQVAIERMLPALLILLLIILAYIPIGLVAAACVLAFRTPGPLPQLALVASGLLGGVYYPTRVIPSWMQSVSDVVPLTYGLRALRRTMLEGLPLRDVAGDVMILAVFVVMLFAAGSYAFALALRYSRRVGTLAHY
jgi:ABC-2 type transport system permease protein